MSTGRQSQAFFEARYQASIDPWQFGSSAYELDRYQATLDSLSLPMYSRGFEPGCSIGVLTEALARRVEHLVACDIAGTAVARAKERCRYLNNVDIYQRDAADGPPEGGFDLIMFSELGYYFSSGRLALMARRLASALEANGDFIAVHWLGHSPDHVLHGDVVHEILIESLPLEWLGGTRYPGFRIDSWRRA
jgi:protein-L-isoaspartate O-methyltransferase